jgi:phospho-N-acetylmuramoyl-pentapeptide-transferase
MHDSLGSLPTPLWAFGIALMLVMLCGGPCIRLLASFCRETIRQDSARLASLLSGKAATPGMGGLLIFAAFLIAVLLMADPLEPPIAAAIALALGLGAIGAWDDLAKRCTSRRGISARAKLAAQIAVAAPVALWLAARAEIASDFVSVTCAVLLIVLLSNAVNLSDGLDGLAGGCCFCGSTAIRPACSWETPVRCHSVV